MNVSPNKTPLSLPGCLYSSGRKTSVDANVTGWYCSAYTGWSRIMWRFLKWRKLTFWVTMKLF